MKKLFAIATALMSFGASHPSQQSKLDYDQLIHLDAEALAEGGIKEAYAKVLPALRKHVKSPAAIEEINDPGTPRYMVVSNGVQYEIYGPGVSEKHSWGNATFALFSVVNRQLHSSNYRFYAVNRGNDLGGMFLTESQVKAAVASINRKSDWPYIPTKDHPWFGQHH